MPSSSCAPSAGLVYRPLSVALGHTQSVGANGAVCEAFAAGMIARMAADPLAADELASTAHFTALNVLRGRAHHHRGFTDNHNGFTADTANPAKCSNNFLTIAGASKDAFVQWLGVKP